MPTIAELLERIKASGGTPSIDPGIDLRLSGTSVNTDPGIDWRPAGEYRNIDPGIDLRSSSGDRSWPFQLPTTTDPSQFMDTRPALIHTEPRPKGWVPWDTQPNRIKNWGEKKNIRDFMRPLSAERDKKSWWKTSNLQNWRQRNR